MADESALDELPIGLQPLLQSYGERAVFGILRRLRDLPPMSCAQFHQRTKHILKCGKIYRMMLAAEKMGLVTGCRQGQYKLTERGEAWVL